MINQNSLAAANAQSVVNRQFQPTGQVLQRKIVIVGTYDPAKTNINDNVPERFFSPESIGAKYGFGYMVHRLAQKAFKGSRGVETWVIPQSEDGGAVAADGTISLTGPATEDGVIGVYIAGELYGTVNVANGDTAESIATAINDALGSADSSIPVTSAIDSTNANEVDLTSKTKGTWGNKIDISLNLGDEGDLPAGVAATITAMANGTTDPDIQPALDGLGVNDNQNEKFFTALIHGYGQDSTTLGKISTYNGVGNDFVGNYKKTVARPFRSLVGNTDSNSSALADLITFTDGEKLDRTNGVLPAPDSENHPEEIAALALGIMERINTTRAEQTYIDEPLPGIRLGSNGNRWTDSYDNRDTAVKSGISPTLVKNNQLVLQNVVTFYRPDDVPQASNGYRSQRNISIIQNILDNERLTFEQEKWKGITIVDDVAEVTNPTSKEKARDVDSVVDELVSLATIFQGLAWIFSASFTVDKLREGNQVVIRQAGNGFDINLPVVLSGEGGILNTEIEFDVSLAVFL